MLDSLPGGFLGIGLDGAVRYGNATAGRILHIPMPAVIGQHFRDALEPYPALFGVIRDALETHKMVHRAEVSIMHGDAKLVIGYSTIQIRNDGGDFLGAGIIFQDLTMARKPAPAPGLPAR